MPYRTNTDLPPPAQRHLPSNAQDTYREAFNRAFAAHSGDLRQEEVAHRTAWIAVKRAYVKVGGSWIGKPVVSLESEPAGREHTSAMLGPSPPGGNFT